MIRISRLLLLAMMYIGCNNSSDSSVVMNEDENSIRDIRDQSNQAIAAHDTLHIGDSWMDNFLILTSTDLSLVGREENVKSFSEHFKERPDVIYVRTPDQIYVYQNWDVASEYGHWEGNWTDNEGKTEIGGTYYAKWHKVKGKWLIRAEVFTPTHCNGSAYCDSLKM